MDDLSQASLLELIAGKNRSSIVASVLSNGDILKKAYSDAFSSEGSADKELENQLNSIEGRISQFNNALQTMWMNFISDDVVKGIVDIGTAAVKLADSLGFLPTVLGGFSAFKIVTNEVSSALNGEQSVLNKLGKELADFVNKKRAAAIASQEQMAADAAGAATSETNAQANRDQAQSNEQVAKAAQQQSTAVDNAAKSDVNETATSKVNAQANRDQANAGTATGTVLGKIGTGISSFVHGLGKAALAMAAIKAASWVLEKVWDAIDKKVNATKYAIERANTALEKYNDKQEELEDQKDTVSNLASSYTRLSSGVNTLTNENIGLTIEEYQEYLDVCNDIAGIFPELVSGYDAQGNAIVNLTEKAEGLTQAYKDAQEAAALELLSKENKKDIWTKVNNNLDIRDNGNAYSDEKVSIQDSKDVANAILSLDVESIKKYLYSEMVSGTDEKWDILRTQMENNGTYRSDVVMRDIVWNDFNDVQLFDNIDDSNWETFEDVTLDDVNAFKNEIKSRLSDINQDISSAMIDLRKTISAGFLFNDVYQDLDEKSKSLVQTLLNDLSPDMIAQSGANSFDEFNKWFQENIISQVDSNSTLYSDITSASNDLKKAITSNNSDAYQVAKDTWSEAVANMQRDDNGNIVVDQDADFVTRYLQQLAQDTENEAKNYEIRIEIQTDLESKKDIADIINDYTGDTKEEIQSAIDDLNLGENASIDDVYGQIIAGLGDPNGDGKLRTDEIENIYSDYLNSLSGNGDMSKWSDEQVSSIAALHAVAQLYGTDLDTLVEKFVELGYVSKSISGIDSFDLSSTSVNDDIDSFQEKIKSIRDAWESLNSGDMTKSEFIDLAQKFPDLMDGVDFSQDNWMTQAKANLEELNTASIDNFISKLNDMREAMLTRGEDVTIVDSFIAYAEQLRDLPPVSDELQANTITGLTKVYETYKSIMEETNEVVYDGQKVSDDYYESLKKYIDDTDALNACFDENNKQIVTNAAELRKLIAAQKEADAQSVRLAKDQAQLEYYNLVKELDAIVEGYDGFTVETKAAADSLLEQIRTVKSSINQYQLLEDSLLGVTSAFENFANAQELDKQNTYGDSYVEMAQTMYDAIYKTGEVGSKAFWAAVEAYVPEEFYINLTPGTEQLSAITDYLNKNVFSTLTLDSGSFSIDYSDIEGFVERAQQAGIFTGTDVSAFGLSIDFVNSIAEGENGLEQFAEQMGMTETQVYAFLTVMDKYNANGAGLSMLLQLDKSTTGQIMLATNQLEQLYTKRKALIEQRDELVASGEDVTAINIQLQTNWDDINVAESTMASLEKQAQDTAKAYMEVESAKLSISSDEDITLDDALAKTPEDLRTELSVELDGAQTAEDVLKILTDYQLQLQQPTVMELEIQKDKIQSEIAAIESQVEGIQDKVILDEDGIYQAVSEADLTSVPELQTYINLLNEKSSIESTLSSVLSTSEQYLSEIAENTGITAGKEDVSSKNTEGETESDDTGLSSNTAENNNSDSQNNKQDINPEEVEYNMNLDTAISDFINSLIEKKTELEMGAKDFGDQNGTDAIKDLISKALALQEDFNNPDGTPPADLRVQLSKLQTEAAIYGVEIPAELVVNKEEFEGDVAATTEGTTVDVDVNLDDASFEEDKLLQAYPSPDEAIKALEDVIEKEGELYELTPDEAIAFGFDIDDGSILTAANALEYLKKKYEELYGEYSLNNSDNMAPKSVKTYSQLESDFESLNSVLSQTEEIIGNGTEVTQSYKETLAELLGKEAKDLGEYFEEGNELVVKNADGLKKLVKQAKNTTKQNVKLAKSQAQLEYYDLVRQLNSALSETQNLDASTANLVNETLTQIDTVQRAIYQYELLEQQLLGAANAFEQFKQAQEIDTVQGEPSDTQLEMIQTIYDAYYKTGEVGSEAVREAVEGLIDPSVYAGLEYASDEYHQAIYKAFNKDVAPWLTLDEDVFKLDFDAVENFVEKGIGKIFTGTNIKDFDLMEGLNLEDAAEAMGMTETMLYAMLAALKLYDGRDFLSPLVDDGLNGDIAETTSHIEELNREKLALLDGGVTDEEKQRIDEINEELSECEQELQTLGEKSYAAWQEFTQVNGALEALGKVSDKTQKVSDVLSEDIIASFGLNGDETVQEAYDRLLQKQLELEQPTVLTAQFAIDNIDSQIATLEAALKNEDWENVDPVSVGLEVGKAPTKEQVEAKLTALKEDKAAIAVEFDIELSDEEKAGIEEQLKAIEQFKINDKTFTVTGDTSATMIKLRQVKTALGQIQNKTVTVTTNYKSNGTSSTGGGRVNGTAHVNGTAFKSGSWGAPRTETALMGELGTEMLVRGNKWSLVGENGAQFTDVRRGDIIFNHKQTESLLKNGYVTGRGKAFAEGTVGGTAYALWKPTSPSNKLSNTAGNELSNASSKLSKAASDISKSSDKLSDDFKEIFDWIAVRIEEIENEIEVKTAKLDNAIGSKNQNTILDSIINSNKTLYDNLVAGASKYYEYAQKLLEKVPAEYREAAQNGSIAIESFTGKVGESALEAIEDYREWVSKGDDLTQQAEETLTEISTLAKQAIENIASEYENKTSIRDSKVDQYEAYNKLLETDVGFESSEIYQAIINENKANIKTLQKQRDAMLAEFNKRVESGEIKKYSQDWYDAVNDIAAVDTEIIELKADTEDWQDKINELHWDKFDLLMDKLGAVSDEAENLIEVLSNKDLVDKDIGEWTDAGITSLGLYAQQMEAAEVEAKKYEEQIKYLNKNWQKLGYTEEEYIDKLDELKQGQYDAIDAYHKAKDAIVQENEARVEAVKTIIQDEIDAYTELINAKKELLENEKDLYDFQKSVNEKQKDIAKIQRQLAALAGDNSSSARAQRAKLEAELLDAQADLEETYYDRSVSNQTEALDKELEAFEDTKNDEIEALEDYLEDTNKVVSDSLELVKANTSTVYQELQALGQEYGLSITESLTSPWKEGENAIQAFAETFGVSMSATVEELKQLELEFMETMTEIEKTGISSVNTVANNATNYQKASYTTSTTSGSSSSGSGSSSGSSSTGSSSSNSYPYGKASATTGNIKQGASGKQVKAIQYALNQLGYGNSGTKNIDGKFGSGTASAIKKFQKAMGISADGIVGKNTRAKFKAKGYSVGTSGVDEDQWAWIDEIGEEVVMHAQNGKLAFLSKGSAVLPHDISENLVKLGQLDPQYVLDANRPQAGVSPSIVNSTMEFNIDASVGTLMHIDNLNGDNPDEVLKIVNKALEQHTKNLNAAIRKFAR